MWSNDTIRILVVSVLEAALHCLPRLPLTQFPATRRAEPGLHALEAPSRVKGGVPVCLLLRPNFVFVYQARFSTHTVISRPRWRLVARAQLGELEREAVLPAGDGHGDRVLLDARVRVL